MAKVIQENMEKTQGEVAAQEAAERQVPIPTQPASVMPTETVAAAPTKQQPAAPPAATPFAPASYMETIPSNILFKQHGRQPTQFEQQSNVRIMWMSLAKRSSDPVTKAVFENLARMSNA